MSWILSGLGSRHATSALTATRIERIRVRKGIRSTIADTKIFLSDDNRTLIRGLGATNDELACRRLNLILESRRVCAEGLGLSTLCQKRGVKVASRHF